MGKIRTLLIAAVILVVIAVMAFRGCPRVRKKSAVMHDSWKTEPYVCQECAPAV